MSPFLIFLIVVTLGYVIYYAAIITIDMNAKPKEAIASGETMEAPDGMQTTEDNDDSEEETTSREADDENDDDTSDHSDEETDEHHQAEDSNHGTPPNDTHLTEIPYEPESETPEYTSSREDDDIYGIDRQIAEEESMSQEKESSASEQAYEQSAEDTPEQYHEETSNSDTSDNADEEDEGEEAIRAMLLKEMQERAKAEGAEFVEAEIHDKNEFDNDEDDDPVVLVDSQNCDTGRADEINANSESIITESTTPVRQDMFAKTVIGALYKIKDYKKKEEEEQEKKEEEKPAIDPDNIEKKEHITKA